MKKIYLIVAIVLTQLVNAQFTYTWTNLDGDFDYENSNNWTPDPLTNGDPYPTIGSNVILDATETTDNLPINDNYGVNAIVLRANYTGTVDCSGATNIDVVNLSILGGTFLAPTVKLELTGNLTKTGGVFVKASNGTVKFQLNNSVARTINGSFDFDKLEIIGTGTPGEDRIIRLNSGATSSTCQVLNFNASTFPMAYRGLINVTGTLAINGATTGAAPNNTGTIVFVGAGNKAIAGAASASLNPIRNITMNHTGALIMSGNICTTGTWSFSNIGSHTSSTSIVTMIGGTVTAGSTSTTRSYFDNIIVGGSGLVLTGTSQMELKGNLTNNSSITPNNSLLIFSGPSPQTIGGTSATTLNAMQVNSSVGALGVAVSILDSVKISGGALTTGGLLTLKSTSAKKARIAEISSGVLIGNITVETFAPGGTTDWANIGVSGVSGLNLNAWDNPATFPMTCNGCINATTSVAGGFASAVAYNETLTGNAAYLTMNNTDALTPGKGFWMYMGLTQSTTADMIWSVSGPAVTGAYSGGPNLTITGSSSYPGYNLVSNPYPSPISFAKVRASNPGLLANETRIYNADLGADVYWNGLVSNPAGFSSDVIPMGQGFHVLATGTGPISYLESHKVSHNTSANQLQKPNSAESANNNWTVIRLNVEGGGYKDQTSILFHPNATANYDTEYDARKSYGSPGYQGYPGEWTARTAIATQLNSNDFAINSLPFVSTQNLVLPVVVRVYGSGSYTISGTDLQNIPGNSCITLKDKLLNVNHDLRASDYVCNINDTTYAARFELTVCPFSQITSVNSNVIKGSNSILINKDAQGIFVDFDFAKTTNANIIVTNVLGQRIMDTKKVKVTNDNVYLDLNVNDQLIFVTVETENEKVTKKFLNFR